jgi:subtilisin family serine protease
MLNIATDVDARRSGVKHKRFVPGVIVVHWKPDIVAAPVGRRGVKAVARELPPQVMDRIGFLRENHGLRRVVDISPAAYVSKPGPRRGAAKAGEAIASSMREEHGALRGLTIMEFDPGARLGTIARLIERGPVEYAHPAPARWLAAGNGVGDPRYNSQWGLPAINWFAANRPKKSAVKVAVLDSGVDRTHPDLKRAVGSYDHGEFSATDLIGHGSHVAGIIAATTNNDIGIAGVANCQLRCWKVFGDEPEDDGEIYMDNAAYYRALEAVSRADVRVVNLSLGGLEPDPTEAELIRALTDRTDLLVVVAMGNEYEDGNPKEYPAALPDVFAVGAMAPNRRRAPFSNTGRHIDIVAPGSSILSTLPVRASAYRQTREYDAWDGTSMATPFVAGAAALVWTAHPDYTAAQVRRRLASKATRLPAMRGSSWTPSYGSGLLNLKRALA